MKIILYFPPLVVPCISTPYASIPLLAGYLKANTGHQVVMKDVNADVIHRLISRSKSLGNRFKPKHAPPSASLVRKLFRKAKGVWRAWHERQASPNAARDADVPRAAGMSLEEVEYHVNLGLNGLLRTTGSAPQPGDPSADHSHSVPHHLLDYWNLKYEQLSQILENPEGDPLYDALGEGYFSDTIAGGSVLVGISVAFFTQFGSALSLAKRIKMANPAAVIAVGGAVIRRITPNLDKVPGVFQYVDCFVETEGEEVLLRLAEAVQAGANWRLVPGVIYARDDGGITNNVSAPFDLSKSVLPDYSLIYNQAYLSPQTLYLRTSIGCYYNRCTFCTQPFGRYQHRKSEAIVADMLSLRERFKAKSVAFCDESVPIRKLSTIAALLTERKANIGWNTYTRLEGGGFDMDFVGLAKLAHCNGLSFGLETGTQRVNDLMRKGVVVADVLPNVDRILKAGVSCGITAMIGFPGETEGEMLETVRLLQQLEGMGAHVSVSIFSLNRGSYVFNHPAEFGILEIENTEDYFYKEDYDYTAKDKVSRQRMTEIKALCG